MNTNIMLLLMVVCIAIQQIEIQIMMSHINTLDRNSDCLRNAINNLYRKERKNEDKSRRK